MTFFGTCMILCIPLLICLASCKPDNQNDDRGNTLTTSDDSTGTGLRADPPECARTVSAGDMNMTIKAHGSNDLKHLQLSISKDASDKSFDKAIQYDGTIQDAVTADLNMDGHNEVYVFNQSAGSGSYGQLLAYQYNGNKLDSIGMDDLPDELSQ